MPSMEAYIYMIELNDMLYFGSTIDIRNRQYAHNRDLKKGCDSQIYKYCRENGINEIELILLECVPIEERYAVEQYYIDEFKGDKLLNSENAVFDRKNYMKEYSKAYRQANRDKIKEQRRLYRARKKSRI